MKVVRPSFPYPHPWQEAPIQLPKTRYAYNSIPVGSKWCRCHISNSSSLSLASRWGVWTLKIRWVLVVQWYGCENWERKCSNLPCSPFAFHLTHNIETEACMLCSCKWTYKCTYSFRKKKCAFMFRWRLSTGHNPVMFRLSKKCWAIIFSLIMTRHICQVLKNLPLS